MRPPLTSPPLDERGLAPVIPLDAARRQDLAPVVEPAARAVRGVVAGRVDVAEVARALQVLRRRAGDRGLDLDPSVGRTLAELERLLAEGPARIDPERVLPVLAAELARIVATAASTTLDLVPDETDVLGEALACDLLGLRLDALHEVAEAVLEVSRAPRAAEHWGEPRAAEAAEAVITAAAGDLREAARSHEWLYEHFTDRVWAIPTPLLERGQRRWRVAAHARLAAALRRASRSGRIRGGVRAAARGVLEARQARARVEAVGPLLSQHLGVLHRGPLSDADDALRALRAIRRLHAALGELVDADRLHWLILGDAFRSEDVFGPAVNIRMGLRAWRGDVEGVGGAGAWALTLPDLAEWTATVAQHLPVLRSATDAAAEIGARVDDLQDLVHLMLLRQHVGELTDAQAAERAAEIAAAEAAEAAERAARAEAEAAAAGAASQAVATAEALLQAMRREDGDA